MYIYVYNDFTISLLYNIKNYEGTEQSSFDCNSGINTLFKIFN